MEDIDKNDKSRKQLKKLIICAGLSLYWIIFLWGFWQKDVFALGLNVMIFLALLAIFLLRLLYKNNKFKKSDWAWVIPIFLLITSFFLYENPFFKVTTIFILPWLFAIFYNYANLNNNTGKYWDLILLRKLIGRVFSLIAKLGKSFQTYVNLIIPKSNSTKNIIIKSLIGLLLLFIISFTIIIPLLSSADAVFAERMQSLISWFNNLISPTVMIKIIFFIFMSVFLLAVVFAWERDFDYPEGDKHEKNVDSIITGIVLGGVLLLYLLFLWIQFKRLWVGSLPFEFKETESLVKSGFWQLFFLSILNITIYYFTYKKIAPLINKILTLFTITSLLLLVSAGYRMVLYVIYYGLSYEKFYASYTVLFCTILFVWLISRLFVSQKSNIVKFLLFLFLWMFALVAIFPVEQFIVRSNIGLVKLKNSQIRLYEMSMLSPDVLSLIKKYQASGRLSERAGIVYREKSNTSNSFDWSVWIKEKEDKISKKEWFELTLSNIIFKAQ